MGDIILRQPTPLALPPQEIHKISVSAMNCAKDCMRRWWAMYVQYWPKPQSKAGIYGDVLHAVCQRFLDATDQGLNVATGMPVDLYPPGWQTMVNRFDRTNTEHSVNMVEQAQIKLLVTTAIEKGLLIREPGRITEQEFYMHLPVPGFDGHLVEVHGFKDLVLPDGVMDHKTASATKWCLSIEKLQQDIQIMLYGLDHWSRNRYLTEIRLGHIQYIKDKKKPAVRQRIAKVTPQFLQDFYAMTVAPMLCDMLTYKIRYPKGSDAQFMNIPGPKESKTCNFYFGKNPCPFINICTKACTPSAYRNAFKLNANRVKNLGDPNMSGLLAAVGIEQGSVVPSSPAPAVAQPLAQPAAVPAQPQQVALTTTVTASGQTIPAFTGAPPVQTPPAPAQPVAQPVAVAPQAVAPIPVQPIAPAPVAQPAAIHVAQPVPAPAPIPVPVAPQSPAQVQPVTSAPAASGTAPWFSPICPLCTVSGLQGFRTDGQPCQVCQIQTNQQAQPVTANTDGSVAYTQPASPEFQSQPLPAAVVNVQEQPVATAPEPVAQPPAPQVMTTVSTYKVAAPAPPQPAPAVVGVSEISYILLMGCAKVVDRSQNPPPAWDAQDMFKNLVEEIKTQSGTDLNALEHFQALEIVSTNVPQAVAGMQGAFVTAYAGTKGSLYHKFVEGLRMYASQVICPVEV